MKPARSLQRTGLHSGLAFAMALCASVTAAGAEAPALDLGITLGTSWSDNIALSPAEEESGGIGFFGLNIARQDDTRRLRSTFDVNLGYQRYLDNEFDSDLVGGAAGDVVITIAPGVFSWSFQDNYTQIRTDALAADTPDNWQSANYFTTGPQLMLGLGGSTSLSINGRYSVDSYGSSEADSQRIGGTLGLVHRLGNPSSVSLNLDVERRSFDDDPEGISYDPDYTSSSAYLNYSVTGQRTTLNADIGYSQVDLGTSTPGSVLARLSIGRRLTSSSSLTLSLDHQYSDTGNTLRAGQEVDGVGLDTDLAQFTSDAFVTDSARLALQIDRNRTSVNVVLAYSEDGHERESDLDRYLTRYSLELRRQVRPTVGVAAEFHGAIERFSAVDARSNETGASVSLDWAMARTLGWQLQYAFRSRGGSGPVARFTENQVMLAAAWSPLARR